MPIYNGSQKIKNPYGGSQKIKTAHIWNGSAWQKVYTLGVSYAIDFAGTGPLPAGWTTSATAPTVIAGAAQAPTSLSSSLSVWALYNQDLATDDVSVKVTLSSPTAPAAAEESGIMLRGGSSWSTGTHVELSLSTGKGCSIKTLINGSSTVWASTPTNIAHGDTVEFTAKGSLYQAFRNGSTTPFLTWTAPVSIVETGPDRRRFGFYVAVYKTDKNYYTPAIDRLEARDL